MNAAPALAEEQGEQRRRQLDDEARAAYAALGARELQELVNLDPKYYQRRLKDLGLAMPCPPR
jgi:hypothetical protein